MKHSSEYTFKELQLVKLRRESIQDLDYEMPYPHKSKIWEKVYSDWAELKLDYIWNGGSIQKVIEFATGMRQLGWLLTKHPEAEKEIEKFGTYL